MNSPNPNYLIMNKKKSLTYVISASSVGTLIEWYDFYIFGSLATVLATKFFPSDNQTAAFLNTLATFAAGFVVRPFGALVFGRLGDLIGRKYTFMVTLLLMGGATFAIGLIPSYETIGAFAPIIVLILRLLQGLALGGEYGGAATYVAEHAPDEKRGFFTSWIQTTATVGLIISLFVIMGTKALMSPEDFNDFGWRIPFLLSSIMVLVSFQIRKNMAESPLFESAKKKGETSSNPLKDSFGNKYNLKFVLLALLGATMGQGLVWYTGQFYAQAFMIKVCNIDDIQANSILAIGLILGTPLFIFFGWLSDKIGRKSIMMVGMLLGVIFYRPIYETMYQTANLENKSIVSSVSEDPTTNDQNIQNTLKMNEYSDGTKATFKTSIDLSNGNKTETVQLKLGKSARNTFIALIFALISFVTMVYGPIAAFLVELFPTKIRYTSMSLPYHIGNGIFGGLMPAIATFLVTQATMANKLAQEAGQPIQYAKPYLEGLNYPIILIAISFIIGLIYIKEDRKKYTNH